MTTDATAPESADEPAPFDPDRARIADAAIEQLRARRFSYGDDRRDIEASLQADMTYSDGYKAQLLEGFIETAEAESMALATRAWRDTLAAEKRLADEVAHEAQCADTGLDHAAISTFMADYSARLSMPPPATGIDTRRGWALDTLVVERRHRRSKPEEFRVGQMSCNPSGK